jgi:hypothetical protein
VIKGNADSIEKGPIYEKIKPGEEREKGKKKEKKILYIFPRNVQLGPPY